MRRVAIGLVLCGTVALMGCGDDKLIVGVVLPETGINKGYGASLEAGIKLAMDDAVAKQSPKGIEARYRDSLSHPEYAAKEAAELFKSGALMVIGGATSPEAKAMIPEAEQAKRVIISPSASQAGLAATSNLFFRVFPSDDIEGAQAAEFLVTTRKAHNILVLYQKDLYGEDMLKIFSGEAVKLGAKITAELPIGPSDWDKPIADAIPASKPDAVYICAYAEETLAALEVVRKAQFPGVVCVASAFANGEVVKRAGVMAEGVFVSVVRVDLDSQQEPTRSFVQRYKAAHAGASPDLYAAYGYDAALIALYSLEGQPPKDNNELLTRVMSLGNRQGVTGKLGFDSVGNTVGRPRMARITAGRFQDLGGS
jgi:branched-chain amino acid transport system substrate-binding protein